MTDQNDAPTALPEARHRIFESKWSFALAGGVVWLVVFCAMHFLPQTAAILQMRIYSDAAGAAQWYFDRGRGFSEAEMVSANIHPGENDVMFRFPQGTYRALRFDPINHDAHTRIETMQWRTPNEFTASAFGVEKLEPLSNIDRLERNASGIDIWPVHASEDPQTRLSFDAPLNLSLPIRSSGAVAFIALAAAFALMLGAWIVLQLLTIRQLVAGAMALAAGLILAMAAISTTKGSVHPDEFSHLQAYEYYVDHILPPAVTDPVTIPSTSVWGFSYLFELDVVYDIAAHATTVVRKWTGSDLAAARIFQVTLWGILCVLAMCRTRWSLVLCVTLLSPQIWYVFSYWNADAFAFFLALIAACVIADKSSGLHLYLRLGERRLAAWVVAVCLGLIIVSKRNYLPIVPVFLIWLAVVHLRVSALIVWALFGALFAAGLVIFIGDVPAMSAWQLPLKIAAIVLLAGGCIFTVRSCWRDIETRRILLRLICLTAVCVAVTAPRLTWDFYTNGLPSSKSAAVREIEEVRAGVDFKPSNIAAGGGYPTIALAARGVPLSNVIWQPNEWAHQSLISAFGVYGYMNIYSPPWMYTGLEAMVFLVILLTLFAVRRSNPQTWLALIAVLICGSFLVLESSVLLSWVGAFQPQGRYLFPIFAMLGLALGSSAPNNAVRLVVSIAVLISVLSFACYGLPAFAQNP